MKKILVLLVIATLVMLPIMSMATTVDVDKIVGAVKTGEAADIEPLHKAGGTIYATIQTAGIILALVVVVVFGVQWLVATPAKKAELKGKMWNIVIGIAIILLASTLVSQVGKMIWEWDTNVTTESEEGVDIPKPNPS